MSNAPQRTRKTKTKPNPPKAKNTVPRKMPRIRRPKRQVLGVGIKTPSLRDYDYTLIQSRADTRVFDISTEVGTLPLGVKDQILFSQSLSAVSAALLQQETLGTTPQAQGNIENALLNYLDYRFTEIKVSLKNASAVGVSGTFAIAFTPPNITFDKPEAFSKFVLGRASDSKPFPGTRIITIAELREKKSIVINAEFQKGGRPIGLSGAVQAGQATVGRMTVGMITDALVGELATNQQPSSSSSSEPQSVPQIIATGDLAIVSIDFKGEWIYYAPDQAATNDAVTALNVVNSINADTNHVDPDGIGDWNAAFATGIAPPELIKLINNEINLNRLRGQPANTDFLRDGQPLRTFLATSGGTSAAFFTSSTVKTVGNLVLDAVASFAPPLIRQLIVWGGRTMIGLIDRYVNTQNSMKAKEQDVGVKNGTSSPQGAYPLGLSLTPTALNFVPGAQPFNNVPLNYPVQQLADKLRIMPVGSIGRNIYTMLVQCLLMGIYPFPVFKSVPPGGNSANIAFSVGDEVEAFVNNTGGVPTLVSTVINNDVTPPTDSLAGIPLFTRRFSNSTALDNFGLSASSNARNLVTAGPIGLIMTGAAPTGTAAQYIVPDFYFSSGPAAYETHEHFSALLNEIHPGYGSSPVNLATFEMRLEQYFDHPVSVITSTVWAIALEFSYAARCSAVVTSLGTYAPADYGIDTPLPGDSQIDSGCCKFTVLVDLTGVDYNTAVSFECVEYARLDYDVLQGNDPGHPVYSSFDPNRVDGWDVDNSVIYFINHLKTRTY